MVGVSEPQRDYEARLDLYAIKGLILRSALYVKDPERRVQ